MKKLCLLVCTLITLSMNAQESAPYTVDVTGEGIVNVVPDQVTITVSVENTGRNAAEVKQDNDATVTEVLRFLKQQNVDAKDIQTKYIRLYKNYEYNSKTYNFVANNSIAIKLRDLSSYETIMNGLLTTGINRIDGISFEASNRKQLEQEARMKAVQNAKTKAEQYASVLDQSIGKAISISEFGTSSPQPPMYKRTMAMDAMSNSGQETMAPGELEIVVKIQISFLLY
ncbi:MAG: SIMPL domain-containing protein [Flavobacteriaceae bacterium]|nr:SIMPL domain-containing protein [Flavobacteriaceae bacterium]